MPLITQDIAKVTGLPDTSAWTFYTDLRQSDDGKILTHTRVRVTPEDGQLSVDLEPGPAVAIFGGVSYPFVVPNTASELWPLIQAAVDVPPNTTQQQIQDAIEAYFTANPPAVTEEGVNAAIDAAVSALVDDAPAALDTFKELAQALQNDPNVMASFVPKTRQVATTGSLVGGGNLGADLSLSLFGDSATPGNTKYYGTNGFGDKGFYDLPDSQALMPHEIITSHGAVAGGDAAANFTAITAAMTAAAASGGKGSIWIPKGDFPVNQELVRPLGISIFGPGGNHAVISTTAAINVLKIGSKPTGAGDRYATIRGFAIDGNGVATLGFDLANVDVQNLFENLEARNIAGPGYRLDATQNCVFISCDTNECDYGWRVLNDAGSNLFLRCETADSHIKSLVLDNDNTLPGYTGLAFGGQGPSQNTWYKCLFEYGTVTKHIEIVRGRLNTFDACNVSNHGNTALQIQVDLLADAHLNTFTDCTFNGRSNNTATYEAFQYAVKNAGYRNRLINPMFEFTDMGTDYVVSSNNQMIVHHPHRGGAYRFEYTGATPRLGILLTPIPSEAQGTTAARPDFGNVGWWEYFNTDTLRANFWTGTAWNDPFSGQQQGASNTVAVLNNGSTYVGSMSIGNTYLVTSGSTLSALRLPTTGVPQGAPWRVVNKSTAAFLIQASDAATVISVAAGDSATVRALQAAPVGVTHWAVEYEYAKSVIDGKVNKTTDTFQVYATDGTGTNVTRPYSSTGGNSTFLQRDAAGRAKFSDPAVAGDGATKGYVDTTTAAMVSGSDNGTPASFPLWKGTQVQYDAIATKDADTVYIVKAG